MVSSSRTAAPPGRSRRTRLAVAALAATAVVALPATAAGRQPDRERPTAPTALAVASSSASAISLRWTASHDNVGVAVYAVYRNGTLVGAVKGTEATVTRLSCGTTYALSIEAFDAVGNRSPRETIAASTAACPDRRPPTRPAHLHVTAVTPTSVSLAWDASRDDDGVAGYDVYSLGRRVATTADTSVTIEDLRCGRLYVFTVAAFDAAGNRSGRAVSLAFTARCDRQPPTAPDGLAADATGTSIELRWAPSQDDVGVAGYGVYRDGADAGTTTDTSFAFDGLECGTTYALAVDAFDVAGNRSARSSLDAATAPCPDTTAPSAPDGLTQIGATATSVTISWNAAHDDVGVTGYGVYREGAPPASSDTTSAAIDGLACGTSYTVAVDAVDAAGNRSGRTSLDVETSACAADAYVAADGSDFLWTHLAVTYDGATLRLYVNGSEVSSRPVTGSMLPSDGPLQLGGNAVWGEWLQGRLDDVRVYRRGLSAAEVQADMAAPVEAGSADGLVAAYSFDEGSGSTLHDLSGHGNDGALSGPEWTGAGRHGGALAFSGTGELVTVPDSDSLDLTDGMTLEAWVRPDTIGDDWQTAVMKQSNELVYALYANAMYPNTHGHNPSGHVFIGQDTWTGDEGPLPASPCAHDDPCLTFDRAYHAAEPGQVVEVEPGSYPRQSLTDDPAKGADASRVVFRPAPGGSATVHGIDVRARHVEFRDFRLTDFWETWEDAQDAVFRDVVAPGFLITASHDVSVLGGSYGPSVDDKAQVGPSADGAEPVNILIDGVLFHDYTRSSRDIHMECLQFGAGNGLTLRNSRFVHCDILNVHFGHWGGAPPPRNILVENNFLSVSTDAAHDGDTFNSLLFRMPWQDTLVRNNSALEAIGVSHAEPENAVAEPNFRMVANVAPLPAWGCDWAVTYAHNVWDGVACSASDVDAPSGFVDPGELDLHLRPDSAAIDAGDPADAPATDIDGDPRPRGAAPDAGADES